MSRAGPVILPPTRKWARAVRVGAVEESNSSGACDFTGENTFRCGILYFPVYCVRPCIASYVIRMPVAKLGFCLLWDPAFVSWARPCLVWSPAFLWDPLWDLARLRGPGFCEALLSVRHSGSCEALPSVRPFLLWDLAFCETLHSVRPCLLWGPFLWGPAFCES